MPKQRPPDPSTPFPVAYPWLRLAGALSGRLVTSHRWLPMGEYLLRCRCDGEVTVSVERRGPRGWEVYCVPQTGSEFAGGCDVLRATDLRLIVEAGEGVTGVVELVGR